MTFPDQTQEYLNAKAPLAAAFAAARLPHWDRYCNGEISHEQYCLLIDAPATVYSNALEPAWVKAGGTPNPKRKPITGM